MNKNQDKYIDSREVEILLNPEIIIKGIQDMIDLAEQEGMTYPRFLRLQIERGLDKAMEGLSVVREAQEYNLEVVKLNPTSPYHLQKEEKKLEAFDQLASKNKFGIPNQKDYSYACNDIDYEFEFDIVKWNEIVRRWTDLLRDLSIWSLSYCSFAPYIPPWNMAKDPVIAVRKTQKTLPGIFKQKEKLLKNILI